MTRQSRCGGSIPVYDDRSVPAHGNPSAKVYLIAEAPGRCEAALGIPLVGPQGGNLYRALVTADVAWAGSHSEATSMRWPNKVAPSPDASRRMKQAYEHRRDFLMIRRQFITCSNACDHWPRSAKDADDFVQPGRDRLLSVSNRKRLTKELGESKIVLVCGVCAWLALLGKDIRGAGEREGTRLESLELDAIGTRFGTSGIEGWYLGHPRRWLLHIDKIVSCLKDVSERARWNAGK